MKFLYISLLISSLSSCDAVNVMAYSIQNKTNEVISIHHSNYSIDTFHQTTDTIIQIHPNETQTIGRSPSDINFPWATINIYRERPGICGLELIIADSIRVLSCDNKHWRYKRRESKLIVK